MKAYIWAWVATGLLVAAHSEAHAARHAQSLPRPNGPFAVGTTTRQWTDTTRAERFTADPHDRRALDVYLWYPAARTSPRSPAAYVPYVGRAHEVLGDTYSEFVRSVRTNSTVEPAVARRPARFPLVVVSHGVGSVPAHYTILAEELASQGYLVAAINHSYGSGVTFVPRRGAQPLHRRWLQNSGVGRGADQFWQDAVQEWAADIRFVIDQLAEEHRVPTDVFGGRLDLGRIATLGHAHGGSAAVYAAQVDRRIRASVVLDGTARTVHLGPRFDVPTLWMVQDRALMDSTRAARGLSATPEEFARFMQRLDATQDSLLSRATAGSYLATVVGAQSNHFSDLPVVFGATSGFAGVIAARRAMDIVRTYVVAFLARHMGQALAGELERLSANYPEVRLVPLGH